AGQLIALTGLATAMFTTGGALVVLPGPAAAAQLSALLAGAAQQIRVEVPPVPESAGLLCLVVLTTGLIAVVVDTLTVSAAAPAASGLVLLFLITVPAAVSEHLLPWWSFALSALGFALLLAVDSQRRQLIWGQTVGSSGHLAAAPAAVAVTAGAMVVALLVGATVTAVGTGRSANARTGRSGSGIGLNPFTSLRGQLVSGDVMALFRIRGLEKPAYLRALTLSRFSTGQGWQRGGLDAAVAAGDERNERLPLPAGVRTPVPGPTLRVRIEPINYVDNWLPSFGYPLALAGVSLDWNYDPDAITIFSDHRHRAQSYTEFGVLPTPDPQLLRAAGPAGGAPFHTVDPRYLDATGVDQRVHQLAVRVTAGTRTAFDATVALNQWFTQPSNGFRYDLRTAPGNSGDALVDFLFTGRRGYCEQFASAMAIMLRTLGMPARVAIGFTPGTVTGNSRLITTDDAHAWVEAWFPGVGWLPFDPTPRSDGHTVTPDYLTARPTPATPATPATPPPPPAPLVAGTAAPMPDAATAHPDGLAPAADAGIGASTVGGARIGRDVAGLLGLAVLAGLTPLGVRSGRRRWRLHLVKAGGPAAVRAAWEEVLAESTDRGAVHPGGETVRASAQRLAHAHTLDEPGRVGLRIVVGTVERSWYASVAQPRVDQPPVEGPRVEGHSRSVARSSDRELRAAVDAVLASLDRCSPLSRMSRLWPRSILRGSVGRGSVLGRSVLGRSVLGTKLDSGR
ncbi:MAG: transglutaminaseTgpA domain-containing protein, partial [Pseudonocardiaceae bacterium]